MKIGVSGFAWARGFRQSYFPLLSQLRERGFRGFEIPMFTPADLPVAAIRRAFEEADLDCTICAILPPGINPIDPDPEVRSKSFSHLVECVQTASDLGAKLLGGPLFAPIGYLPGHRPSPDERKWAVECFQSLGAALDANQVTLSLEPVNRSETFFLRTAAEARSLCEAIGHPRIGVTIDTFHANIEEKSMPAAVRSLGPWLRHIHASENDRGVLGSGHVGLAETLQVLREIDYDGYIVLEGFGYSPAEEEAPGALWADLRVTPEDIAFQGLAYLRSLGA